LSQAPFDLLIAGGQICDGTGLPLFGGDLGVRQGRIVAIGELDGAKAARRIDARGRVVAPGFIDIHSHSDESVLVNPRLESTLRQGVTTVVAGNCGSSSAPAVGLAAEEVDRRTRRFGLERTWTSFAEYLEAIERRGTALNFCSFVGHGRLRQSVMGGDRRPPTAGELAAMKALLAASLEEGAIGLASGLIYPPSAYAETAELAALSNVVAGADGLYASHMRNEGARLFEAVEEGIEVGRQSGARVQLSHHKAAGRRHWGKVKRSLAMIADARESAVDVAADQYPYTASSTGLRVVIPEWAHEGGTAALVERLRDPEVRRRIRDQETETERQWEAIVIARARAHPDLAGRTVAEIASERGVDPLEAACDLLVAEDGTVDIIIHSMCEEDVQEVMSAPFVCVGSDSSAAAQYGVLSEGRPHPRTYGCFPRILGRYVRELGMLTVEEAVRKMTSLTASRLKLRDRGRLAEGCWADVVVFDPLTIADAATFDDPHRYPVGIEAVVVNGRVQLERGEAAPELHGVVLRLGSDAG
jgi:N-acyl-D-amino-acid deacylase